MIYDSAGLAYGVGDANDNSNYDGCILLYSGKNTQARFYLHQMRQRNAHQCSTLPKLQLRSFQRRSIGLKKLGKSAGIRCEYVDQSGMIDLHL